MVSYYRLAGINMTIDGKGKYADAIRDYFYLAKVSEFEDEIQLSIEIEDSYDKVKIEESFYSLSGTIAFNRGGYCVKRKNYIYSVSNLFNDKKPVRLKICKTPKKNFVKNLALNMISARVGLRHEKDRFVDSVMNYGCFLYILAVILLRQKKIFVHSSVAEYRGNAYMLCGTSGCGKTSTLFAVLQNAGSRYMAEDFAVMSKEGCVEFIPKKMAVYQSDAKYKNPDIINALRRLPLTDRMHWACIRMLGMNPRYRFAPEQIFSKNRIALKSQIQTICFLSRVKSDNIKKKDISTEELCTKIKYASFRELSELYEILYNIRAVGDEGIRAAYPDLSELEEKYTNILMEAISNKRLVYLEVPLTAHPQDIAEIIMENKDE